MGAGSAVVVCHPDVHVGVVLLGLLVKVARVAELGGEFKSVIASLVD